jgi:hypothetical protein
MSRTTGFVYYRNQYSVFSGSWKDSLKPVETFMFYDVTVKECSVESEVCELWTRHKFNQDSLIRVVGSDTSENEFNSDGFFMLNKVTNMWNNIQVPRCIPSLWRHKTWTFLLASDCLFNFRKRHSTDFGNIWIRHLHMAFFHSSQSELARSIAASDCI